MLLGTGWLWYLQPVREGSGMVCTDLSVFPDSAVLGQHSTAQHPEAA